MLGGITFGGLMSGIDTDSVVNAIVNSRRFYITGLENQAAELNYYKSILRKVNTYLLNLQRAALDLRLESTFKTKRVTVSNENLVSATAGFDAVARSYMLEVNQLARGANAISGLGSRAYLRGAAALIQNNTAGVQAVEVTSTNLTGVRATMNSLITETLQAGKGSAEITAGDQITITGTTKDSSAVNATFTFNGDNTDTIQRLANTIQSAFKGEVTLQIDSNGSLMLVESDITAAGNFSLTGFNFVDADYSGSTLSIGIGESLASGGAQTQVLTGMITLTTGDSSVVADATTLLDFNLDQLTGGNLDDGEDKIHITGKDHDGNDIDAYYTYTTGDTFQQILDSIETAFGSTISATMENGKIVITDTASGDSDLSLALEFEDTGANSNEFNLGIFLTTNEGASETQQIIKTAKFEVPAVGKYFMNFTEGKGGQITGTVSLDEDTLLGDSTAFPGLTNYNLFTIDRDTGSGTVAPVTIFGLTARSSIRDLVEAINAQVPDVTARLVPDGSGQYYLQITANRGGENLRLADVAGGILENVLNPSGAADTDWTTSNATTDADDFTVISEFTPNVGTGTIRTIVTADEGNAIEDLIENLSIEGSGTAHEFSEGIALVYTNESSELNIQPSTHAHIIGASGISLNSTTPRLNLLATLAEAGFATTPQNAIDNPNFHTDGFFTINGQRIEIDDVDNMTVNELLGEINSSGAGVVANYDSASDRIILRATERGANSSITLGGAGDTSNFLTIAGLTENTGAIFQAGNDAGVINPDALIAYAGFTFLPGSGTFTINGVTIHIDQAKDTLNTVIRKINNSGAGVIAVYDKNTDRLSLTQDLTKEVFYDRISVGNAADTSAFLASVRLTDIPSATMQVGSSRQRAEFILDGTTYNRESNRIDDVIADVTLNLMGVTSTPVNIDISIDTERSINSIANFVAQYNVLMELINPAPLNTDERELLVPLTESEMNSMSLTDIEEYEQNRQSYRERDTIFKDTTVRRVNSLIRQMLFNPVASVAGTYDTLASLGINTGIVDAGVDESKTPYLVDDSTDIETIAAVLNGNLDLLESLSENADEIYELFSNPQQSKIEVAGTMNMIVGMTVTSGLRFHIGTHGRYAVVSFSPGNYTYTEIINQIRESLANANLNREISVSLDSGNRLVFSNTRDEGKAEIYLFDANAGDSMEDLLGLESGTYWGEDAQASAGLGIRLDSFLKSYTGVGGIIRDRVTTGGQIDREIGILQDQIENYEDRLAQYEERIRRQFVQMEIALAQFQQTSQFLSARLAYTQNQQSNSSSSTLY